MINRRSFLKHSITASSFFIGSSLMHPFLRTFYDQGYNIKTLRDNVGYFTESGGTIGWYFGKNGATVIDTQFPEQAEHLILEMKKETSASLKYLINTHHHGDHTAGNIAFKGLAENIVAHENSKINQMASAKERGSEEGQLYPDHTYTDIWKGEVGEEKIEMLYWGAGHTNGDSITHFTESNVAHLGDLVFNRRYPYIDKNAGADIENWINVLHKINEHFDRDTIMMCGHSDNGFDIILTQADVLAFEDYLKNLLSVVGKAIKAGKTEEEIMAITEITGSPEWKGKGISRSLSAAYEELK